MAKPAKESKESKPAATHPCHVTYRVPVVTESGRQLAVVEVADSFEFSDEEVARGCLRRSVIPVDYLGDKAEVTVEVPLDKFVALPDAIVTHPGLVVAAQKVTEVERVGNTLTSKSYSV